MTKMATMPIYGKNPSNIFFCETNRLISMKLGVKHPWLKYYNVYINHDPVMTLTKLMAWSTCMRGSRNFHERGSYENGNFWSQTRGGQTPQKSRNYLFLGKIFKFQGGSGPPVPPPPPLDPRMNMGCPCI